MVPKDMIAALEPMIHLPGSFDITTIQAHIGCIWCVRPFTSAPARRVTMLSRIWNDRPKPVSTLAPTGFSVIAIYNGA